MSYAIAVSPWLLFIGWAMFEFSLWFALLLIIPASLKVGD